MLCLRRLFIPSLIIGFSFIVTPSYAQNLDCGVRPPQPPSNPNIPKYGPFEWDNPQIATRENFPWQVAIFKRYNGAYKYECGGTLIPGGYPGTVLVLTGARCVTRSFTSTKPETDLEKFRVVVGPHSSNYNKNSHDHGAQKFKIRKIEIHPLYEAKSHDSDAALIRIDGNVELGPLSFPVCLPPNSEERSGVTYGMVGEIAGFGWDTRRNVTESMRYARYPILLSKTCQEKLGVKVNDFLEICTGYEDDSTACQGDYGGGLVFRQPKIRGRYFIQGLLSNLDATPVTEEGYCQNYNVFKRIGPFLQWIQRMQTELLEDHFFEKVPKPRPTSGLPLNYIPTYAKIARDYHNHVRHIHKSPNMRLVAKLQASAQELAERLAEDDSEEVPEDAPFGTNVYAIPRYATAQDAMREALQYWYSFYTRYNRNDPKPSPFTQMIWKTSRQVGAGVATNGDKTVVVVTYWPKGNTLYRANKDYLRRKSFADNVFMPPRSQGIIV